MSKYDYFNCRFKNDCKKCPLELKDNCCECCKNLWIKCDKCIYENE